MEKEVRRGDPEFIVIVPARYASSRFPGKPLAKLGGKEMILHVAERCRKTGFRVVVATDDERIFRCVTENGYEAVMTSETHRSGTDRVMEAYDNIGSDADVVINVQGDEPFIDPGQITSLAKCFLKDNRTEIATLCRRFDPDKGFEALFDPNLVKLTMDENHNALYFSRSIIPYVRNVEWKDWLTATEFFTHIGIYAYRSDVLSKLTSMPQSSLERAESLEQLRWLQGGYRIKVAESNAPTIGIDTPDDLANAEKMLRDNA